MAETLFQRTTLVDAMKTQFPLESLDVAIDFLEAEYKFWTDLMADLPSQFVPSSITKVTGHISALLGTCRTMSDAGNLRQNGNSDVTTHHHRIISQLFSGENETVWISRTNPAAIAWRKAANEAEVGNAFFEYLCHSRVANPHQSLSLKGVLLAYEFQMQGESGIVGRRAAEQTSFDQIQKELLEKKHKLIDDIQEKQSTFKNLIESSGEQSQELLAAQQKDFENQAQKQTTTATQLLMKISEEWSETEAKHREILHLQGPAEYWKKRAVALQTQGRWFAGILGVVIIASIGLISTFFYQWIIHGQSLPIGIHSLQGALLFASVVSLVAYAIKTLSRLTFSSFHLQRDAEERVELTHLYLSLANESKIDEESRKILYQALFSRAESGLLANEHGPTMPSVTEFLNRASSK